MRTNRSRSGICDAHGYDFVRPAKKPCVQFVNILMTVAAQTTSMAYVFKTPKDGGSRRLEVAAESLQLRMAPSADSAAIKVLKKGAVVSNLGCIKAKDQLWCQVQPLRAGYVAMFT